MTVIGARYELSVEGVDATVAVRRIAVDERMHASYCVRVTGALHDGDGKPAPLDVEAALGAKATVHFETETGMRELVGVVSALESDHTTTTFSITHPIDGLRDTGDHRLFLGKDSVEIATEVLQEHALQVDVQVMRSLEKRPQCVQAFESDYDFVSRILAEEGVCWHVDPADASHTVVFSDHASAYRPLDGGDTLTFRDAAGMASGGESVFDVGMSHRVRNEMTTLRDWDFEHPDNDLTVDAKVRDDAVLEYYQYPGAGRFVDKGVGEALAQVRLDARRNDAVELTGRSTCPRVSVARTFRLENAPRQDLNRDWVVVSARATASDGFGDSEEQRYAVAFVAIPADAAYRPEPAKPPPFGGVCSANITGPSGEEIHTDEYGRVRALFRWDRRGKPDETASNWMRVTHPPTSGGFMLPRVGWEALVATSGRGLAHPYVLGRLDTGAAPPPEALPANKVRSNFGTPSTPGGGGGHMVRIDDTAGGSDMKLFANKNYNEKTTANKATGIKGNDTRKCATQDLIFDSSHTRKVDASQSVSVGADRKHSADGGMVIDAGSELVAVGGTREVKALGDYACKIGGPLLRCVGGGKIVIAVAANNRHVSAASTVVVGGAWLEAGVTSAVNVIGVSSLSSGATNIKTGKYELDTSFLNENCATKREKSANFVVNASTINLTTGALNILASKAFIVGKASVKLTAGGATIEVTPGVVNVTGTVNAAGDAITNGKAEHE